MMNGLYFIDMYSSKVSISIYKKKILSNIDRLANDFKDYIESN